MAYTRFAAPGSKKTRRERGDAGTRGHGDTGTRGHGERETGGQKDRGRWDWGHGGDAMRGGVHGGVSVSPRPVTASPRPRVPVSPRPRVSASPRPRPRLPFFAKISQLRSLDKPLSRR